MDTNNLDEATNECQKIPEMIRDAFLRDFRDGRSKLWGWSFEEVRAALQAYRTLNCRSSELIMEGPLSYERRVMGVAAEM